MSTPRVRLSDGSSIPQFGLGVFQVPDENTQALVEEALDVGYRHVDTASYYENEGGVGRAVRSSRLPREDIFVTTKLWNTDQGRVQEAFDRSLERLDIGYVDLYLIHWPCPDNGLFVDTWAKLQEIRESGLAKSVGVANFLPEHLEALAKAGLPRPPVNQIELHPWFQAPGTIAYCRDRDIAVEAWTPLGRMDLDETPVLVRIGDKYGKTPAQVVLRWHVQSGNIVFPKTLQPRRLRENLDIFDFSLTHEEMEVISALESGRRTGPNPADFCG